MKNFYLGTSIKTIKASGDYNRWTFRKLPFQNTSEKKNENNVVTTQ